MTGPAQVLHGDVDLLVTLDSPNVIGLEHSAGLTLAYHAPPAALGVRRFERPSAGSGATTRELFLAQPHVSLRIQGDRQPIDEAVRKRLNVEMDVRVATDSVPQMPFLLPGTTLIAVLPEELATQLASCLSIRVLEIPEEIVPARRVELVWHRRNEADPAHLDEGHSARGGGGALEAPPP